MAGMRRPQGTGHLHVKSGAYYVRWRALDGRQLNRRIGTVRSRGESDGLTRPQAERAARELIEKESSRPSRPSVAEKFRTVNDVADGLRERLLIEGARLSYRQNCESMQRIHIGPVLGKRPVEAVTTEDVERLARVMLARGSSPKTVRRRHFFSSARTRSDIGIDLPVLRSDLPSPECSPRTHALRTRMRRAWKSTSRQRIPSASD